jgi:hypothetical protein
LFQAWLVPLFTNHGLKDNQDESDFFDGAALFYAQEKSLLAARAALEALPGSLIWQPL